MKQLNEMKPGETQTKQYRDWTFTIEVGSDEQQWFHLDNGKAGGSFECCMGEGEDADGNPIPADVLKAADRFADEVGY